MKEKKYDYEREKKDREKKKEKNEKNEKDIKKEKKENVFKMEDEGELISVDADRKKKKKKGKDKGKLYINKQHIAFIINSFIFNEIHRSKPREKEI